MSPVGITTPQSLLNYFKNLQGNGIVSGEFIETGDPASVTTDPLQQLQSETGRYPGMIGIDYWHFNTSGPALTQQANADAVANWQAGGLVELSLAMPNPTTGGGSQDTSAVDAAGLLTPGTATNDALNTTLSQVAAGLRQLQDAGVVVLFRPYHESNGNWFWWGADDLSAQQFQALWQYTYNYLTNTEGLHNLVWVYSINAGTALPGRTLTDTYPGDAYVDMTGQDYYGDNPTDAQSTYDALQALGKPTALSEFGSGSPSSGDTNFSMPDLISQVRATMPNTVYWLQWWAQNAGGAGWGMEQDQNTGAALNDGYVVNRGEIAATDNPANPPPPTQAVGISPNDTVVTGAAGAITDASGNAWTITSGGQVAVNGVADQTTANVIELAYVNGTVWQENADQLWWGKTGPSAPWSPTPGTATSPLPAAATSLPVGTASNPLKVMPMGDSMTASGGTAYNGGPPPGGYRAPLYAGLTNAGFTIQYVGDQTTNAGGGLPANEDNHEGIGGYSIETVDNSTTSPGLLNYIQDHNILHTYQPDVILLDIGYNNIYVGAPENVGPAQAFNFLQQMISYIFQQLPNVKLLVGTVPATSADLGIPIANPNSPSELGYYNYLILNKLAPTINNPNLSIIDINGAENAYSGAGSVASLIGPDGIHPTVPGFQVMAQAWQVGLAHLTNGGTTTPPPAKSSPNDTVVTAGSSATITDATGNAWTITAGGQVAVNGTPDQTTANVIELAYVNGTVWQENASKLWWGKSSPSASWLPAPGTPTSPLPAAASANDTVLLTGTAAAITDGDGNAWTITTGGQVAVNGTADQTTANVTELAYVNGTVWQENANNLWWSKTAPSASWLPTPGTPTSPLPGTGTVAQSQTATTVSLSQVKLYVSASSRMLFVTGTGDTITIAGGAQSTTDKGGDNTYVLSTAGEGVETFTSNILTLNDTLDLRTALTATDWNHDSSTLSSYLRVTSSGTVATLSIAPTAGGKTIAIATIDGAAGTSLSALLAHALT